MPAGPMSTHIIVGSLSPPEARYSGLIAPRGGEFVVHTTRFTSENLGGAHIRLGARIPDVPDELYAGGVLRVLPVVVRKGDTDIRVPQAMPVDDPAHAAGHIADRGRGAPLQVGRATGVAACKDILPAEVGVLPGRGATDDVESTGVATLRRKLDERARMLHRCEGLIRADAARAPREPAMRAQLRLPRNKMYGAKRHQDRRQTSEKKSSRERERGTREEARRSRPTTSRSRLRTSSCGSGSGRHVRDFVGKAALIRNGPSIAVTRSWPLPTSWARPRRTTRRPAGTDWGCQ